MTTTQRPQDRTTSQRAPCRYYAIPLQVGYKATSQLGPLYGFGQIRMVSSKHIIFGPRDGLQPGMNAEIVVAWPRLLDGRIRLQLVLETIITSSKDSVAEARILAYDFRTAGLAGNGNTCQLEGVPTLFAGSCNQSPRPSNAAATSRQLHPA